MLPIVLLACQGPSKETSALTVRILPAAPSSQDDLYIELSSDDNIDLSQPSIQWFQNDTPFDNASVTLESTHTQKEDRWSVNILISADGQDIQASSDTITILNSPPRFDDVTLSPLEAITGIDDLHCDAQATDPDGDALSYS